MKIFKKILLILTFVLSFVNAQLTDQCLELSRASGKASFNDNTLYDTRLKSLINNAKKKNIPCVYLGQGTWQFNKPITIPENMYIKGNYENIHNLTSNDTIYGTTISCNAGAGLDSGSFDYSCILMGKNSGVKGLNLIWPAQKQNDHQLNPISYPWGITCIASKGSCTIENVTLSNAYNGVYIYDANNNYIHNLNMGVYKRGLIIDGSTSNFGTIHNMNIHDQFLWSYYSWPVGVGDGLNPLIYHLEESVLYKNMTGVEIKNSYGEGIIKGLFIYKARNGFIFDNPMNKTASGKAIELINSGCDLCNWSVKVKTAGKADNIIQFYNSQAFGKVDIAATAYGDIRFINTQMSYYVTEFEDDIASYSHITNNSPNVTLWLTNCDITTTGIAGHKFSKAMLYTAGVTYLRNVNMIDPYLYAEETSPANPTLTQMFKRYLNDYFTIDAANARHFLLAGDASFLGYYNGYALGYDNWRPISYRSNGTVITDASRMTNFGGHNLIAKGQWTSDNIRHVCNLHAPTTVCYLIDDDANYRYRPRNNDDEL